MKKKKRKEKKRREDKRLYLISCTGTRCTAMLNTPPVAYLMHTSTRWRGQQVHHRCSLKLQYTVAARSPRLVRTGEQLPGMDNDRTIVEAIAKPESVCSPGDTCVPAFSRNVC